MSQRTGERTNLFIARAWGGSREPLQFVMAPFAKD
jgi:hypothetical protein